MAPQTRRRRPTGHHRQQTGWPVSALTKRRAGGPRDRRHRSPLPDQFVLVVRGCRLADGDVFGLWWCRGRPSGRVRRGGCLRSGSSSAAREVSWWRRLLISTRACWARSTVAAVSSGSGTRRRWVGSRSSPGSGWDSSRISATAESGPTHPQRRREPASSSWAGSAQVGVRLAGWSARSCSSRTSRCGSVAVLSARSAASHSSAVTCSAGLSRSMPRMPSAARERWALSRVTAVSTHHAALAVSASSSSATCPASRSASFGRCPRRRAVAWRSSGRARRQPGRRARWRQCGRCAGRGGWRRVRRRHTGAPRSFPARKRRRGRGVGLRAWLPRPRRRRPDPGRGGRHGTRRVSPRARRAAPRRAGRRGRCARPVPGRRRPTPLCPASAARPVGSVGTVPRVSRAHCGASAASSAPSSTRRTSAAEASCSRPPRLCSGRWWGSRSAYPAHLRGELVLERGADAEVQHLRDRRRPVQRLSGHRLAQAPGPGRARPARRSAAAGPGCRGPRRRRTPPDAVRIAGRRR